MALPVVLLASSRGLALGCRDAFARFRADPSAAADYHSGLGFAPAKWVAGYACCQSDSKSLP